MKDNFSKQSSGYAKYRPTYPRTLFDHIFSLVPEKYYAWDCGTGTGQVASVLADSFKKVFATDISENQIKHAVSKENIIYKVESAAKTSFNNNKFDLITVAQAIHWFDFEKFYEEVKRTLKPGGIIAIIGYHLPKVDNYVDEIIDHFYTNIIGKYWDSERKYMDEFYKTIPFPFEEIECPQFYSSHSWSLKHFIGFLETWSAVQHYKDDKNSNPVELIEEDLKNYWSSSKKVIRFPVILRVGKTKQA